MLEAAVARGNITPPLDIPNGMWVAQRHVRGEGLHQELWVTALYLKDGDQEVIVLDFDLCILSDQQAVDIRQTVSKATGVDPDRVVPCCTHNHAGPVTQDTYLGEGADRVRDYVKTLPAAAAGAARTAQLNSTPVRLAAGSGHSEIGLNRDLTLDTGRIVAGPNPEGFADQEVGVLRLDTLDGEPLVCIVNYACHPTVLGPANKLISPDFPGTTKRTIEALTGATCVFLQGASGNMGPREGFVGDRLVAEKLGRELGLEAAKVFLSLDSRGVRRELKEVLESGAPLTQYQEVPLDEPAPRLALHSTRLRLPLRKPVPELFGKAQERLEASEKEYQRLDAQGVPADALAKALQEVERERLRASRAWKYVDKESDEVELHVLSLGQVAVVFMWGEPYSQIGAQVKENSPYAHTLFTGYVGGDSTYIATPDVFLEQPPFEVENCPFAPEAAQVAVDTSLELLRKSIR
ncbi:MAG: hypothetical protein WD273_03210 [Trueperaceae bacterium]